MVHCVMRELCIVKFVRQVYTIMQVNMMVADGLVPIVPNRHQAISDLHALIWRIILFEIIEGNTD